MAGEFIASGHGGKGESFDLTMGLRLLSPKTRRKCHNQDGCHLPRARESMSMKWLQGLRERIQRQRAWAAENASTKPSRAYDSWPRLLTGREGLESDLPL